MYKGLSHAAVYTVLARVGYRIIGKYVTVAAVQCRHADTDVRVRYVF